MFITKGNQTASPNQLTPILRSLIDEGCGMVRVVGKNIKN